MTIKVTEKADGLVLIRGLARSHNGLWARCTVRKPFTCKIGKTPYDAGSIAYRPMCNTKNRMHRIAESYVIALSR